MASFSMYAYSKATYPRTASRFEGDEVDAMEIHGHPPSGAVGIEHPEGRMWIHTC